MRTAIDKLHQANGTALINPNAIDPVDLRAAQRAFDRGQQAWNEGRFVDASKAFAEAYQHVPSPQFLYNVGASLDKAGDTQGAVRAYQQYLNADPQANDAERVKTRIHQLLDRVGAGLMKPE